MQKSHPKKKVVKEQKQRKPGLEYKMDPHPVYNTVFPGASRLFNKKCIVTGGDSGIGRAVAIAFAKEGADVAIIYLPEEKTDASFTAEVIKLEHGKDCMLVPADLSKEKQCERALKTITKQFKKIDVVVNNAGTHYRAKDISDITDKHLMQTFAVNIFSMFWIVKGALPFMKPGAAIINTASVVAYRGSPQLLDYSATKGAVVSFTRSLSANLMSKGIRVNAVAPGPVWTPLIVSSFPPDKVASFGTDSPMGRPAQPAELAPAYVFLASDEASYISGQTIHVNGGEVING
jgi:NAD(P)-dependent dehydrogenase (short-subunit alcohol dehydrogenase family)